MDKDYIILKAQFDAMRTVFLTNVTYAMARENGGNPDPDRVWLYKFLLWQIERKNLSDASWHDSGPLPSAPDIESVNERRFHLQILQTIACIEGSLPEQFPDIDIPLSLLHPDNLAAAQRVLDQTDDRTESALIETIKKLFP